MRIDYLKLTNFRGYESKEFDFTRSFNVLIGDNASGKTATLEALAIALDPWIKGATGVRARSIEKRFDVRRVTQIEGGTGVVDLVYPCVLEGEITVNGSFAEEEKIFFRRMVPSNGARNRTKETNGVEQAGKVAFQSASKSQVSQLLPLVAYYGTERRKTIREKKLPSGKTTLQRQFGYKDSLDARVDPRIFESWMKRQEQNKLQSDNIELPIYTAIREALINVVEGAKDIRYLFKLESVSVVFEDGRVLPLELLSDGQKGVIRMVGDLARRAATLNPGLGGNVLSNINGVVLIDELGLHLHPKWQRKIVGHLRSAFPKVQFIVATHSPFIVQSIDDSELIPLDAQPVHKTDNLNIKQISEGLMGVEQTDVGEQYSDAKEFAHDYLETLNDESLGSLEKLKILEEKFRATNNPFADNPAFQAVLERKRIVKLGA